MDYKDMSDEQLREVAKKRVEIKKEFRIHLLVYILVNAFLVIIYFINSSESSHFWPIYPICGWGIGLLAHAFDVRSKLGNSYSNEVENEIDKLKRM